MKQKVKLLDVDGRAFAEFAVRAEQLLVLHYEPVMA